ncbi:hypothetical protein PG989_005334 [Apiospora arundinis]|uniref:FAD-binding domain-containing protein n=1 Tax=Apiospora arundinis TaxID=335852 RepID=A0ABR2ITQ4_9PEZI
MDRSKIGNGNGNTSKRGDDDNQRRLRHTNGRHASVTTARSPRSSGHRRARPRLQTTLVILSLCAALLVARLLLLRPRSHLEATASPQAEQACKDIHAALLSSCPQQKTYFPRDAAYWAELNHYWSKSLADLRPACVVQPATASHVGTVIRVLSHRNHTSVRFAVKSGGHDPNPGHASVDGGVLIALRHMEGTRYDAEKGVAYVKPGGEWNDVIGALEPHGVTVVGGRLGIVGVGGFLLQGGLSFLSAQHGLAADSIIAWETVLANGTIVNITQDMHPDLAVAMRGGGNQFGIVTQFTMKTHPMGKIWGGVRLYRRRQWDRLQAALHDFTITGAEDPKAAIIFADFFMYKNMGLYMAFFFYDGEEPPASGPFADLLEVSAMVDFTSTKKYSSLTFTLPAIPNNPRIYDEIATQWRRIMLGGYLDRLGSFPGQCSVEFQPLPAAAGAHSEAAGGNAMGLRAADPDRIVLNLQCMWLRARDDATVRALAGDMTAWLEGRLPAWNMQAGLGLGLGLGFGLGQGRQAQADDDYSGDDYSGASTDTANAYMPLFMNDAMSDQDVLRSYDGYERFRELQRSVDPEGMFRTRVGGHKY